MIRATTSGSSLSECCVFSSRTVTGDNLNQPLMRERAEAFQFVNPDAVSLSRRERA